MLHTRDSGNGRPLIALHGLGLESTSFAGLGRILARHGMRTVSVDLPGFGKTPAPEGRLTFARLAEPVIELAGELGEEPLLLGMSLGGRVALEAALRAPSAFRGVVLVAPALPRERSRWAAAAECLVDPERLLDPERFERIPIEVAWPLLKRLAKHLEANPAIEEDWLTRIGRRAIYHAACPATRAALMSAFRELACDPATGPESVWARLPGLAAPAAFVWGARDRMISPKLEQRAAECLPGAVQVRIPCAGHYSNGSHFRCHLQAMADAALRIDARTSGSHEAAGAEGAVLTARCLVEVISLPSGVKSAAMP